MKKILLMTGLLILLVAAMPVMVIAAPGDIGVNVGDSFVYRGTLVLWEADEGVPFPPNEYAVELQTYNDSNTVEYTVTDIVDTNVTFSVVTHWKNGSDTTEALEEDTINSFP